MADTRIARVQMPDGRIARFEVPADTTPEQVISLAKQQQELTSRSGQMNIMSPAAQQIANDPISKGARNFAADMPVVNQALAGAGKAYTDIGRGALQAGVLEGVRGVPTVSRQDIDESRRLDQPLMNTGGGLTGNIVGNVSSVLPTMAIPGANTFRGATAIGGALGGLQPLGSKDSRLTNVGLGAAGGLTGQALGSGLGLALRPVASRLGPEEQRLAGVATQNGIPLNAAQTTGSKPLRIIDSVLDNLPFTSAGQAEKKQLQQTAFNRAVGRTFGHEADALTPQEMGQARLKLSQKFSDLSQRNTLLPDDQMLGEVRDIVSNADRFGAGDVPRIVRNFADELNSKVTSEGGIPGLAYRQFDSMLGRKIRSTSDGDLRAYLGELQKSVRGAMDRSISAEDSQAWQEARKQYKNLLTVAPLAARSESGNISGRTLLNAANQADRNVKFGAPNDLADLGRVGRAFVAESIPDSGTAQRQFYQNLLTGQGLGVGLGAGTGYLYGGKEGALGGAAAGAGLALGGPRLAQALLNSKAGQSYLQRGLVPITDTQRAALANALRTGALSEVPALENR